MSNVAGLTRSAQTGPKDCLPQCGNKRLCRLGVTPSISMPHRASSPPTMMRAMRRRAHITAQYC